MATKLCGDIPSRDARLCGSPTHLKLTRSRQFCSCCSVLQSLSPSPLMHWAGDQGTHNPRFSMQHKRAGPL